MSKYINVERLKAEIERRKQIHKSNVENGFPDEANKITEDDNIRKKLEQPEVDLEKAAQNVYESWMGGTMDDVRRDMVELDKVLNARKK